MGDIVVLAFNSVFPLLALLLVGIGLRAKGMICDSTIRQLNTISSKVLIPCLLFRNVYSADLQSAFVFRLFLLEVFCVLFIALVLWYLIPLTVSDIKQRFSFACCLYWPNCTMFGLPILTSLCGPEGTVAGTIMIATVAPMFTAGSVVLIEQYRNTGGIRIGKLILRVAANPMLWGSLLGISCNLLQIRLPRALYEPIQSIAGIATPLALICLGAFCKWDALRRLLKKALCFCMLKLLLIPALILGLGCLLGYRGLQLLGLLIIFASPSAVSTFSIAEPDFADCDLSALLVSSSSLFSVASFFLWIVLFHLFGLF